VTISQRAGKFYASILVEAENYPAIQPQGEIVGVDFGLKNLAILSDGTKLPANQILKANLDRLGRLQRKLSRKPKSSTSKRRAKAKLRTSTPRSTLKTTVATRSEETLNALQESRKT